MNDVHSEHFPVVSEHRKNPHFRQHTSILDVSAKHLSFVLAPEITSWGAAEEWVAACCYLSWRFDSACSLKGRRNLLQQAMVTASPPSAVSSCSAKSGGSLRCREQKANFLEDGRDIYYSTACQLQKERLADGQRFSRSANMNYLSMLPSGMAHRSCLYSAQVPYQTCL